MELLFGLVAGGVLVSTFVGWRREAILETATEEELTRFLIAKKKSRLIAEQATRLATEQVQNLERS